MAPNTTIPADIMETNQTTIQRRTTKIDGKPNIIKLKYKNPRVPRKLKKRMKKEMAKKGFKIKFPKRFNPYWASLYMPNVKDIQL
jgi:hypothetical protein